MNMNNNQSEQFFNNISDFSDSDSLTTSEASSTSKRILPHPKISEYVNCDLSKLLEGLEISPKTVLNMTVLAKIDGRTDILERCDEYVKKNLDIISKMKSTFSLPIAHLVRYFECSSLPASLKCDFIIERWKCFFSNTGNDNLASKLCITPAMKIMCEMICLEKTQPSVVLLPVIKLLTRTISVSNCFSFAVLAEAFKDDEMKASVDVFFSQHVADVTSNEIFISLRKSDLLKLLKACSLAGSIKAILAISWMATSCHKSVPPAEIIPADPSKGSAQECHNILQLNTDVNDHDHVTSDNSLDEVMNILEGLKEKFLSNINQKKGRQAQQIIPKVFEHENKEAFKTDTFFPNESEEQFFESKIPAVDCFKIAVAADKWGLEDVKTEVDRLVIRNFVSVVETGSAIFEENHFVVLLKYLESTSIPKALRHYLVLNLYGKLSKEQFPTMNEKQFVKFSESCRSLICGIYGSDEPNQLEYFLSEQGILDWEFSLLRNKRSYKSFTLGPDGGMVELHGCCLLFPEGALEKEMQLTMSVDSNPDNFPKDGCAIAPIFGVRPSMQFAEPVTVRIRTWLRTLDGKSKFATLFSREDDSEWKEVEQVRLKSTNEVEFSVTCFSDNALIVLDALDSDSSILDSPESESSILDSRESQSSTAFTVKNSVYIQCNTGVIQSNFFRWEKDEHDVHALMRRRNCSVFTTQYIEFEGSLEDVFTVKVKLTEPKEKEVLGDMWLPTNCFTIKDIQKSGLFTIHTKPDRPSTDGFIEGVYKIFLGEESICSAYLSREWPVTLDPEVRRETVNNISAMIHTQGNAPITYNSTGGDTRVEANMPRAASGNGSRQHP